MSLSRLRDSNRPRSRSPRRHSTEGRGFDFVDISGQIILSATWPCTARANVLYNSVMTVKPGVVCRLVHAGREVSPRTLVGEMDNSSQTVQVVWSDHDLQKGSHRQKNGAFVAVKSDNSSLTWGRFGSGGIFLIKGFLHVCSNQHAFAAIKADKTAVAWGDRFCSRVLGVAELRSFILLLSVKSKWSGDGTSPWL